MWAFLKSLPKELGDCCLPSYQEERTFPGAQRSMTPESYHGALKWTAADGPAFPKRLLPPVNLVESVELLKLPTRGVTLPVVLEFPNSKGAGTRIHSKTVHFHQKQHSKVGHHWVAVKYLLGVVDNWTLKGQL